MILLNENLYSSLYVGNGAVTTYATEFFFSDETEILVIVREPGQAEVELELGTDYTTTGAGNPSGGNIILNSPLPSGHRLRIVPNIPITQGTDYQEGTAFPSEVQEKTFDRQTQISQMLAYRVERMGLPITANKWDIVLPQGGPEVAGFLLRYDALLGEYIEAVSPLEVATGSQGTAFGQSLFNTENASSARGLLGLGSLATQSGTFSGTSSGTNTGDQNTISTINVTGEGSVSAASLNDDITFEAGNNFAISSDNSTKTVTFGTSGTAGKIIQVVGTTKTDAAILNPTNSWNIISDFSATITPNYIGSRILVMINLNVSCDALEGGFLRLYRNGSVVSEALGNADGSRTACTSIAKFGSGNAGHQTPAMIIFYDSPNTTSACTYELAVAAFDQFGSDPGMQIALNRSITDTNSSANARSISTITLMEVAP